MSHPIVLIHGMWSTAANWDRIAALLRARGYECHVPTLPAHEIGVAHPEVGSKSLREYVAFLEDYVKAQRFAAPPILVGHSMGGLLAQQLAVRLEAFAIVLLTPAAPAGVQWISWTQLLSFLPALLKPAFWRRPQKLGSSWASARAFNGIAPERHAALYAQLVEESGRVVFELGLWWLDPGRASRVDFAAVQCPVYVVSAGEDRLTPGHIVRKVAARYPQAALRHYPDRGHWVLDDLDTDEMTADFANWLQGQEQRAAAQSRQ